MCNILLLLVNEFSLSITFLLLFETVTSKLQHTLVLTTRTVCHINQILIDEIRHCTFKYLELTSLMDTIDLQIDNFLRISIFGSKYWSKCDH